MKYELVVQGEFASLNEFINANRTGKGKWNKGNTMKKRDQHTIAVYISEQLKKVHIDKPVILHYTYYCKNRKRDLDNISGYFHKILQDALVECGVLHNDSWAYIKGFTDDFLVDNKNPRIEIVIEEIERGING